MVLVCVKMTDVKGRAHLARNGKEKKSSSLREKAESDFLSRGTVIKGTALEKAPATFQERPLLSRRDAQLSAGR